MLFDKNHIFVLVISLIFVILALLFAKLTLKSDKQKNIFLKVFAILTLVIHISSIYVSYFQTGTAKVDTSILLPMYPCNVAMWLLIIVAFMKNKQSKIFKILAEAVFYIGIVGAIIGVMFNEIYMHSPNLADWNVLKGFISHTTMLVGVLYLLTGGYIKIRVHNVISVAVGLMILIIDGISIIGLLKLFNLSMPNIMYLLEVPFDNLKWINTWTIGLSALLLTFMITAIYEFIAVKEEERWYHQLRRKK